MLKLELLRFSKFLKILRLVDVAVAVVVALTVVVGLVVQFRWESQAGFIVEDLEIQMYACPMRC